MLNVTSVHNKYIYVHKYTAFHSCVKVGYMYPFLKLNRSFLLFFASSAGSLPTC